MTSRPSPRLAALVAGLPIGPDSPFDVVFAVRVGVPDGRHPGSEAAAHTRIAAATTPHARLFVDGRERPVVRDP